MPDAVAILPPTPPPTPTPLRPPPPTPPTSVLARRSFTSPWCAACEALRSAGPGSAATSPIVQADFSLVHVYPHVYSSRCVPPPPPSPPFPPPNTGCCTWPQPLPAESCSSCEEFAPEGNWLALEVANCEQADYTWCSYNPPPPPPAPPPAPPPPPFPPPFSGCCTWPQPLPGGSESCSSCEEFAPEENWCRDGELRATRAATRGAAITRRRRRRCRRCRRRRR